VIPGVERLLAATGLLGRSTRTALLKLIVACLLASVVLFVLRLELTSGRIRPDSAFVRLLADVLPWLKAAATILFFWLAARRFQDQDRAAWLALLPWAASAALLFVPAPPILPLLILVAFLIALFLPGTVGPNRYGPDPRGWKSLEHYEEERRLGRAR
jgi:uncharacterized membrane protein YhaH (DUF805 family)